MPNTLSHLIRKREEFEKDAIELLTCPICFEYLSVPTYQCIKGHILCSECFKSIYSKYKICPQCRCRFDPENYINSFFNEMLNFFKCSCKYAEHGCKEELNLGNLKTHEENCSYSSTFCCPATISPIQLPMVTCSKKISINDIVAHFQFCHRKEVWEFQENKVYLNRLYSPHRRVPDALLSSILLKLPCGYVYLEINFKIHQIHVWLLELENKTRIAKLKLHTEYNLIMKSKMILPFTNSIKLGWKKCNFYVDAKTSLLLIYPLSGFWLTIKESNIN